MRSLLLLYFVLLFASLSAQKPHFLIDEFPSYGQYKLFINEDGSGIVLSESGEGTSYLFDHIESNEITSIPPDPYARTFLNRDLQFAKNKYYLTGGKSFDCDIFEFYPHMTIMDKNGFIDTTIRYSSQMTDVRPYDWEMDSDLYHFVFSPEYIYIFSSLELLILDYNGQSIDEAIEHFYSGLTDVIWLAENKIMIIEEGLNSFIDGRGEEISEFNTTNFGKVYGDDSNYIFSVVDSVLFLFNKEDLSVHTSASLPDGELVDVNYSTSGISLLVNNEGQKKAFAYDFDLNVTKELTSDMYDRWNILHTSLHNQNIYGLGPMESNGPNASILHNLEEFVDFTSGDDLAIKDYQMQVSLSGFMNTSAFFQYSFIVENLSPDTIFSAHITSDQLAYNWCQTYHLEERIDSTNFLHPFESRSIIGSLSPPYVIGTSGGCIYIRTPNDHADPILNNNSTCSELIVVSTNNIVENNIEVYRKNDAAMLVDLNDFIVNTELRFEAFNAIGQRIQSVKLREQQNVVNIGMGHNIIFYRISNQSGLIKTGKIF